MRNWLVNICVGCASLLLLSLNAASAFEDAGKTRLVYFSSFPEIMQSPGEAGLAELASAIREETEKNPNTFFINGGASLGPSVFGAMDNGAHMIDILNSIGPSVMAVGKREFSYGYDNFILNALSSTFPLVSSNLQDATTGDAIDGTYPTFVLESDDLLVGVIALTSSNALLEYGAVQAQQIDIDLAIRHAAGTLADEGVHAVILLADTDFDDLSAYRADGTVDVIFYTHNFGNPQSLDAQGTIITEGALDGKIIVVDLWLEPEDGASSSLRSATQLLTLSDYAPAEDIAALVSDYRVRLDQLLGPGIASVTNAFDTIRENIRSRENAFANLVADALREQVKADVMIINGGSIRGNRTYPAGHQLSRGDIQRELPFGNKTALLRLRGDAILEALEHGVDCGLRQDGCFTHVSNLKVTYDSRSPKGSRLVSVLLGDEPIDPDRYYRTAVSDFMAGGNDGFDALVGAERLYDTGTNLLIWNVVSQHVARMSSLALRTDGRIVDVGEPRRVEP